jgi:Transcriptional regulatory protein, C terminal
LKTKRKNSATRTINLVGCAPVLCERIRASLRRSPFLFPATPSPLSPDDVDLYVLPVADAPDVAAHGVPVIAWGPAEGMRRAWLYGCDDYLREPWGPEELALRAQAVLSRAARRFSFPWGEIDLDRDELRTPGGTVALTRHESSVLAALLRARGLPVPRAALWYALAGREGSPRSRAIDMHISALRRKVGRAVPASRPFIVCVRGQGYMVK